MKMATQLHASSSAHVLSMTGAAKLASSVGIDAICHPTSHMDKSARWLQDLSHELCFLHLCMNHHGGKHVVLVMPVTVTFSLGFIHLPYSNWRLIPPAQVARAIIGPDVRADFRRLYPANAKTPTCCPSDDNRTKVTNSVTSARSLWWHVGPYFWPADLTRTAKPIS